MSECVWEEGREGGREKAMVMQALNKDPDDNSSKGNGMGTSSTLFMQQCISHTLATSLIIHTLSLTS